MLTEDYSHPGHRITFSKHRDSRSHSSGSPTRDDHAGAGKHHLAGTPGEEGTRLRGHDLTLDHARGAGGDVGTLHSPGLNLVHGHAPGVTLVHATVGTDVVIGHTHRFQA